MTMRYCAKKLKFLVFCSFFLSAGSHPPAIHAECLAVRGGRIYTDAGGLIENGVVLIENGKIARVGRDLAIFSDVTVVELPVVIPGLIDMHTHGGTVFTMAGDPIEGLSTVDLVFVSGCQVYAGHRLDRFP